MAITASTGATVAVDTSTATTTKTVSLPSDAPAGSTLIVGILNRTNNTATLVSVSDTINGTWTLTNRVSGPVDTQGVSNSWMVALENSAALTGAGQRVITVETSVGISTQLVAGWIDLDGSTTALTFNAFATAFDEETAVTAMVSNTVANASAGAIVGFCTSQNASQTTWTEDAGGDVMCVLSSVRCAMFFKDHSAGGGPHSFTTTAGAVSRYAFHVVSYSEAAGGDDLTWLAQSHVAGSASNKAVASGFTPPESPE
jgi:hypothetical protein